MFLPSRDTWYNQEYGLTTNKIPQDPPLYAVNIFGIIQLFNYGECFTLDHYCLNIRDFDLEKIEEFDKHEFNVS